MTKKEISNHLFKWFKRYPTSTEIKWYEKHNYPKKEEGMTPQQIQIVCN